MPQSYPSGSPIYDKTRRDAPEHSTSWSCSYDPILDKACSNRGQLVAAAGRASPSRRRIGYNKNEGTRFGQYGLVLMLFCEYNSRCTPMNSSSLAPKDSPNLHGTAGLLRAKPVLFLQIPKASGGSFLTVLGNVFGESQVRRLRGADKIAQPQIDRIVSDEIQDIDCLVGYFPIHAFAKCLDKFRPFTILRDPVHRVMSLFRFLRRPPRRETEWFGLREGFGFDDLIEGGAH